MGVPLVTSYHPFIDIGFSSKPTKHVWDSPIFFMETPMTLGTTMKKNEFLSISHMVFLLGVSVVTYCGCASEILHQKDC